MDDSPGVDSDYDVGVGVARLAAEQYLPRGAVVQPRATPAQRANILLDALPDRIRVGPHDFRLVKADPFDSRSVFGALDLKAGELRLAPHASPSNLVDTLLHECLHGLWRFAGLGDEVKEEPAVTAAAGGLIGLFRDNDWLLGWIAGAVK